MLALATPVVMAELGWVTMGIVDTHHGRRPGRRARLAPSGWRARCSSPSAVFAMGLLLGLDPLVAQAFGARRLDECHRWLVDGVWLRRPRDAADGRRHVRHERHRCRCWGFRPSVLVLAQPYLAILTWSLPPLLLYVAFRRYLQAMNLVRPVMYTLVAANIVNAVANWILIYGHFGAPGAWACAGRPTPRWRRASSWRSGC